VLDAIVYSHYGDALDGKVEAVLSANPGLAAQGPVLKAGVRIFLPDLSTAAPTETAQLWG
jgi:P2-like prophage tail protein X